MKGKFICFFFPRYDRWEDNKIWKRFHYLTMKEYRHPTICIGLQILGSSQHFDTQPKVISHGVSTTVSILSSGFNMFERVVHGCCVTNKFWFVGPEVYTLSLTCLGLLTGESQMSKKGTEDPFFSPFLYWSHPFTLFSSLLLFITFIRIVKSRIKRVKH